MGGMSKAFTDPFCLAPLRQRETRLDGSDGVGLLSLHSTPKKRWCKRCNTPMGNLIQTLLPAVILMLQGKIAKQVSPYVSSILTLIIAGNAKLQACCSQRQTDMSFEKLVKHLLFQCNWILSLWEGRPEYRSYQRDYYVSEGSGKYWVSIGILRFKF